MQVGLPLFVLGNPHAFASCFSQMERRDRLRKLLAHMGEDAAVAALGPPTDAEMAEAAAAVAAVPTTEVFYTEGPPALADARQEIAQFSLRRAALRLAAVRRARENPDEDEAAAAERQLRIMTNQVGGSAGGGKLRGWCRHGQRCFVSLLHPSQSVLTWRCPLIVPVSVIWACNQCVLPICHSSTPSHMQASELGDERPIVGCCFSPDGSQLATGSWSGTLKVWAMPSLQKQLTIKAHAERVTGVAWHPEASTTGAGRGQGGWQALRFFVAGRICSAT